MSIAIVKEEIKRFLASTEPEVICISGKWGVGKTFTWNLYLEEAIEKKEIGLSRYSYVSLFGQNEISDVKASIVEGIISTTPSAKALSEEYVEKLFKKSGFFLWKWMSNIMRHSQFVGQYVGGYEHLVFLGVGSQIVCIDDLERIGKDLTVKEIFGLVTLLKEQRKCKVVILFNKDELSVPDKKDFEAQLEKVIDVMLNFQPTPDEASDIAFSNPNEITQVIHRSCVQLGITNIRVIKKIEKNCLRLNEILSKKYPELMTHIIQSATIFGWAVHQPDEAPSLDFLKKFNRISYSIKEKIPEVEQKYCDILEAYNYTHTDEFDLTIMEGIMLGYFDVQKLEREARKIAEKVKKDEQNNSFHQAWKMYHDSYDNNEEEVMKAMYDSVMENSNIISSSNLNSVVTLLKQFNRNKQAQELIAHFVKTKSLDKEVFDLKHDAFGDIKDPDIIQAFNEVQKKYIDPRDPIDVLEKISINNGWNPEDEDLIEKLDENSFYEMFKVTRGARLHHIVRASVRWSKDSDTRRKAIGGKAIKALQRIAKESEINTRRVRRDGVDVEVNTDL